MKYIRGFLILLLATQCAKNQPTEYVELETFLDAIGIDHEKRNATKNVFIIPNAGCSGCILNSETFMFETIDRLDSSYFILTSFNSLKALQAKYNKVKNGILKHKRIVIDFKNDFARVPIDQKYPIVLSLKKGRIRSADLLDVDNTDLLERFERK